MPHVSYSLLDLRWWILFREKVNFVQFYFFVLKVSLMFSCHKIPGIFMFHLLGDNLPLKNSLLYLRMPGNHMTADLVGESIILDPHMETHQLFLTNHHTGLWHSFSDRWSVFYLVFPFQHISIIWFNDYCILNIILHKISTWSQVGINPGEFVLLVHRYRMNF